METEEEKRLRGKVFSIEPKPEGPKIQDIENPRPEGITTRENQICITYYGDWSKHWGKAIRDTIRGQGCSLRWQCYLGSFLDCKMTKQRKPACFRCQFKEECREVADARE